MCLWFFKQLKQNSFKYMQDHIYHYNLFYIFQYGKNVMHDGF